MKITQEHKTEIEDIISGMACSKDFKCYESGFENLCKVQIFKDGELVECLDEAAQLCKFSFNFGLGHFCKCSLRRYIAQNFNR